MTFTPEFYLRGYGSHFNELLIRFNNLFHFNAGSQISMTLACKYSIV